MAEEKNNRYRAGKVDAELKAMNKRLDHITKKLDANLEWQREVDTRLATGRQRFAQIELDHAQYDQDIEKLKNADRGVMAMATTIGGVIGAAAAAILKFLVP